MTKKDILIRLIVENMECYIITDDTRYEKYEHGPEIIIGCDSYYSIGKILNFIHDRLPYYKWHIGGDFKRLYIWL